MRNSSFELKSSQRDDEKITHHKSRVRIKNQESKPGFDQLIHPVAKRVNFEFSFTKLQGDRGSRVSTAMTKKSLITNQPSIITNQVSSIQNPEHQSRGISRT